MAVYGVLLTDIGWKELDQALEAYAQEGPIGKYLYPSAVDVLGMYCHMTITAVDGSGFVAEIDIPSQFVKFVISATEKRQIGFITNEGGE